MKFNMWSAGVLLVGAASACGSSGGDSDPVLEPTYANVEMVIRNSCTSDENCHGGGGNGKARLNFARLLEAGTPITQALVNVEACEYDLMPRIDPGNPENSWFWVKVAGEHNERGFLTFTPDASWRTDLQGATDLRPSSCPLVVDGRLSFGEIMPQKSETGLGPNAIELFRQWIVAGAPGPDGVPMTRDAGTDAAR